MKKSPKKRKNAEPHLWRSLLCGCAVNLLATAVLLLVMTKIALESKDPGKMLLPLALVTLLLCGFGIICHNSLPPPVLRQSNAAFLCQKVSGASFC